MVKQQISTGAASQNKIWMLSLKVTWYWLTSRHLIIYSFTPQVHTIFIQYRVYTSGCFIYYKLKQDYVIGSIKANLDWKKLLVKVLLMQSKFQDNETATNWKDMLTNRCLPAKTVIVKEICKYRKSRNECR